MRHTLVAGIVLAAEVWQGSPIRYFVGAVALAILGPLRTWAIVKRYPETARAAWVFLGITGGIIATFAMLWLLAVLWA